MSENKNPTFIVNQVMNVMENGNQQIYLRITIHVPRKNGESILHGTYKLDEVATVPLYEDEE